MGCVVNGPGESKHANIGISLPGTFEEPKAPVYVDGRLITTLKGDQIVAEFIQILDDYVDRTTPPKKNSPQDSFLVLAWPNTLDLLSFRIRFSGEESVFLTASEAAAKSRFLTPLAARARLRCVRNDNGFSCSRLSQQRQVRIRAVVVDWVGDLAQLGIVLQQRLGRLHSLSCDHVF